MPGLPVYDGVHLLDLVVAVAVGIACAPLVAAVRRGAVALDGPGRERIGMPALLLGGGLAVGLLALTADGLGADPQDVLLSGQASMPALVAEDGAKIVVVLLAAKALAYGVSLGSGFRGGPIFPAIFLGVALAILAVIAFDVSPTLAVAVGAGAGTAAGTGLLLTPLVRAALLVGRPGLDAVPRRRARRRGGLADGQGARGPLAHGRVMIERLRAGGPGCSRRNADVLPCPAASTGARMTRWRVPA